MAGKGSSPRPFSDYEKFQDNFDAIFNKPQLEPTLEYKKCEKCGLFWATENVSKNHCICPPGTP